MASSTKGVKFCITKSGATPTTITYTAITKAKPAVVTATTTGLNDGDLITVTGTGMASIDGKSFVVANKSGTDFELEGSDTTGEVAAGTGGTIKHYSAGDMACMCWSSFDLSVDEAGVISTATYCDPSSSVPSAVTSAGSISFAGYVGKSDADYTELLKMVDDGASHFLRIQHPTQGTWVAPITFSNVSYSFPIDGAVEYSGSAVLGSKLVHLL